MLAALGFAANSWRFVHQRVRATATVTENVSAFAKEGGVLYYPRFRFNTANGELVQVLATSGSDEIEFPAGDTVPVLYLAGDPQGAVISTAMRVYAMAIWLGLLGIVVFDLGWVLRGIALKRGSV